MVMAVQFLRQSEVTPRRSSVTYRIGSVPHFGVELTGSRTVPEVNSWESGQETTETVVNI